MHHSVCTYVRISLSRDLKFYLTVEQALLCGDPLLVEGVATPIDPALQPLFEMVHSWNNTGRQILVHYHMLCCVVYTLKDLRECFTSLAEQNPVQFCGRKILANPGFTLFLTTALPLSSFPPTLTCIVCPLDFSFSQPWTRELLFQSACCLTDSSSSPDGFDKV